MKSKHFFQLFLLLVLIAKHYEAALCGDNPIYCPPEATKWRQFDGTCNNLNDPGMGAANKPYARWFPPKYADGISKVAESVLGGPLPNARLVTEQISFQVPEDLSNVVRFIGAWLQFFIHDHSDFKPRGRTTCCTSDMKPLDVTPPECSNINIPANDSVYSQYNATCMPMLAAANTFDQNCETNTYVDQISTVTPAMDLDLVYGRTKLESDDLREFRGGRLIERKVNNEDFLPLKSASACQIPRNNPQICYKTGDSRANQNPDLMMKHIMWFRFHNRCADKMSSINYHWSDDRIFQECRNINIAVYQRLTYDYALKKVIGEDGMKEKNLIYPYNMPDYFYAVYNSSCKLNPLNELSQGAFRVLHSILVSSLMMANEDRKDMGDVKLMDHISNQGFLEQSGYYDSLLRGGHTQRARRVTQAKDSHITSRFGGSLSPFRLGTDLIAIDIQRSREHGIQGYNFIRERCGLPRATSFEDFLDVMTPENLAKIRSVYSHLDDVDFIVGGMSETPVSGALVGPTVKCVIQEALQRIQKCDRFWYDNKNNNLNFMQIEEIRSTSLASFTCSTSNIEKMQMDPLKPPDPSNLLLSCETEFPVNLYLWKEF